VVGWKCSQNYCFWQTQNSKSIKLHCLQNCPLVQLYTSTSDCKVVGNIRWKPICESLFSSSVAFLITSLASQKRRLFSADFSRGNGYKSAAARSGEYRGMLQCCHIVLGQEILDQNRPVYWSIVVKGNELLVLHFLGLFFLTASLRRRRMSGYIYFFTVLSSGMNP